MALGLYARSYYTINPVRVYRLAMQHLCNSPAVQEVSAVSSLYKRHVQGRFEQAAHWLRTVLRTEEHPLYTTMQCTEVGLDKAHVGRSMDAYFPFFHNLLDLPKLAALTCPNCAQVPTMR